ncbi:hypothetical protein J8J40_23265, partial [Mycobacterium tuberculosis]|nr:hypothetical protein [Mycobacterium tuberculosis]
MRRGGGGIGHGLRRDALAAERLAADDARLDQHVVRAADHHEMLDIVATDEDEAALAIDWFSPPRKILDPAEGAYGRWFVGATCNTCFNA